MKNLSNFKVEVRTREYLVQAIFQLFFNEEEDVTDIVEQFKDEHKTKRVDFYSFISDLKSIQKNKEEIHKVLIELDVKDTNLDLMDKSILYFALNEMMYGQLDKPIVIDEALRLSKKFSNPESYKFINANLDKFLKSKK